MKTNPNCLFSLALLLAGCTSLATSCTNESPEDQQARTVHVADQKPGPEHQSDTSLRLKFTKGVRAILEDSKGNVWFGSHQEGVAMFDGKTLTYFTEKEGLSDRQVRSIYEDAQGNIWFEGGRGLSRFDGQKIMPWTFKNYLFKNNWQVSENDLWFKGNEEVGYNQSEAQAGVYRYDGSTLHYLTFPIESKATSQTPYSVSTPFFRGQNGRVWFGTYGAVFGYDGQSFTIIDDKSLGRSEETGYLHVRSIFEDSKGHLWIGNNGIGVLRYDGETTHYFSKKMGLISENSGRNGGYRSGAGTLEHVFAIAEDDQGNMWFGDRDTGAWRYDGTSMKNFTEMNGLTTKQIWQIYTSKNGELWFAMADGSVCKFNGTSFERIF